MNTSDYQFFEAIDKIKRARQRLRECKPEQVEVIKAAYEQAKAAWKVLDRYFAERVERRDGNGVRESK